MRHPAAVALLAGACLAGIGCAKALREPPSLEVLAHSSGNDRDSAAGSTAATTGSNTTISRDEVSRLLDESDRLFAERGAGPAPVERAAESYQRAATFGVDPSDDDARAIRVRALIGAVRARVWLADHGTDPSARLAEATAAVQSAQWCGRTAPGDPACDYWLGAALGIQARERPSTGLSALPLIEQAFQRAAAADPAMEEAGPDRALALLYLRAPGWPAGPGDPDLGLEHARKAIDLKPESPENHLALGEALAATGDPVSARTAFERALALARTRQEAHDPDATGWIADAGKALAALAPVKG